MMRMGLVLLSIGTATFVACGGGGDKGTTAPDNGGGAATPTTGAFKQWGKLLTVGASWTFDDRIEELPDQDVNVVTATVAEVRDVAGGKAIILGWTENGAPMEASSMPEVIVVTDASVTFYGDKDSFEQNDAETALVFPAAPEPAKLDGGLYIDKAMLMPGYEDDPGLCYGYGPEEGADDCEDVCFSQLCVDPDVGLTGGEGTWWPNYGAFQPSGGAAE
jgi:hypothetical protein